MFKGFVGSICVVLCPQELEQRSVHVRSYMHAHFSVTHALYDVSLLSHRISGLIFKNTVAQ